MKSMKNLSALLLCLILLVSAMPAMAEETPAADPQAPAMEAAEQEEAPAEPAPFRGWNKKEKYQYVHFGNYPKEADGSVQPMLWRVLTTNEPEGYAMLMTELVVDGYPIIWVERKEDREKQNFRRITCIEESDLYTWMNSTMAETMFTEQEMTVLQKDRGILFVLNASEMCKVNWGFTKSVYSKQPTRICKATEYAKARGVYEDRRGGATYWVNDLKSLNGYRMRIVGYNGHMSYGGYSRQNIGIRPAVLVDMTKVEFVSGTGAKDDPYLVQLR